MKIKDIVVCAGCLIVAMSVLATVIFSFKSWDDLKLASDEIVIAEWHTTKWEPIRIGTLLESDGTVIASLKGKAKPGPSILRLSNELKFRENEKILIFGFLTDNTIQANESYRVISLGNSFSTNMLSGKTLDENIKILLRIGITNLDREIQYDMNAKQRLEQGLH